jgi:hypothetical protein
MTGAQNPKTSPTIKFMKTERKQMKKTTKLTKIITLILMLTILLSIATPIASAWNPPAADMPFTDSINHWARNPIAWAVANNITSGTSATTFSPEDNVTRAQFVTFLFSMSGRPTVDTSEPRFSDVEGHWAINGITWAADAGVTSGVGNNRFAPDDRITREQIVTMIRNYTRHMGGNYSVPGGALDRFPDRGAVSGWATGGVGWAASNGIIGAGGTLNPRGYATRAETITMLHRMIFS